MNTYNVSTALAPVFTGGTPDVRSLPGIVGNFSSQLSFPRTQPSDEAQRIETSLDSALTTPYNYSANLSFGRELHKGLSIEFSYVGRFARNLLAQRDIMHLNNLRDPKSGMTWYQAINQLVDLRLAGVPVTSVASIPWFENLVPGLAGNFSVLGVTRTLTATQRAYQRIAMPSVGGSNVTDYTFRQLQWDDSPTCIPRPGTGQVCPGPAALNNMFFHPQYGALNVWSTLAKSNYNSLQVSVRQRLKKDVLFDLNYTYGHSLDNASGLQSAGNFSSGAFIFNPLDPNGNYADSDFDVRHIVNANWVIGLPMGRGRMLLHDADKWVNGIFGGWQLTGIFRWNSGAPTGAGNRPFGFQRWPTNWNLSSGLVRVRPIQSNPAVVNGSPNIFSDPTFALLSFRDARPGEAGDRNVFRNPSYIDLDAGLTKVFHIGEKNSLEFRWEVFNVTNTQRFTSPGGFAVSAIDPFLAGQFGLPAITTAPSDFGKFTSTQTPLGENKAGRVMQFALRWKF